MGLERRGRPRKKKKNIMAITHRSKHTHVPHRKRRRRDIARVFTTTLH